jgi:hypothetical protein
MSVLKAVWLLWKYDCGMHCGVGVCGVQARPQGAISGSLSGGWRIHVQHDADLDTSLLLLHVASVPLHHQLHLPSLAVDLHLLALL